MSLFPSMGGSGVLATRLGEYLADRGHAVHLLTYDMPFLSSQKLRSGLNIELVERQEYPLFDTIGQPYSMSLASKMLELAFGPGLDVFHVHYAIPHILSAYAASRLSGIPYVVTLHGSDAHSLGWTPSFKVAMRLTLEQANAVTTVSQFLKERIHEKIGVEREVVVIPNFIDIDVFKPRRHLVFFPPTGEIKRKEQVEDTNPCAHGPFLFHASNFRAGKRVPGLIDAFRIVVDSHPKVHLIIAGDGPERGEVERKIKHYELEDNVKLLGVRHDIRELMCCSEIYLQFSEVEGMPLTIMEAMACGIPVITTPVGGTPELVRPDKDGIVTKGVGIEEYAHAIIDLLQNEPLRRKVGAAGRKRVEESFSVDVIVPRYEKILEQVIG
ncbi:MAG: N-acetyl-alpha-D-glucosaminyl L-malate synthase BshA [Candidatus Thorarchaeota archaeon]